MNVFHVCIGSMWYRHSDTCIGSTMYRHPCNHMARTGPAWGLRDIGGTQQIQEQKRAITVIASFTVAVSLKQIGVVLLSLVSGAWQEPCSRLADRAGLKTTEGTSGGERRQPRQPDQLGVLDGTGNTTDETSRLGEPSGRRDGRRRRTRSACGRGT